MSKVDRIKKYSSQNMVAAQIRKVKKRECDKMSFTGRIWAAEWW